MRSASLDGARLKLRRAARHRDELSAAWENWATEDVLGFTQSEPDADGWVHLQWAAVPPLPSELALCWGDMLSNARAALDYLVWQLVLVNRSTPHRGNAWPVVHSSDRWREVSGRLLRGVAPEWVAEIERRQPFHFDGPHPLAALDDMNNINKHRLMQEAVLDVAEIPLRVDFTEPTTAEGRYEMTCGPAPLLFRTGARFCSVRVHPSRSFRVEFSEQIGVRLSFTDGEPHDWPVLDTIKLVSDVLDAFEPAYPQDEDG